MKAPCRNCEKRVLGCHDACPDYREYKLWAQRKNALVRNQTRSDAFYDEMTYKFNKSEWWR